MRSDALLTIGMPVFNGERFLPLALDSLLRQTFDDFVIILSDNASTDRTEEIGRDYAASDRRIRYLRSAYNVGAGNNFLKVYTMAKSKYYKQAAHDDFCHPRFLETCISALEKDSGLTVSFTKVRIVDSEGILVEDYECPMRVADNDPVVRFADLILVSHRCFPIFGIHRMNALRQLPAMGRYAHADGVLLAQLGLLGRFYESPDRLFTSTRHARQSVWTPASRITQGGFRLTRRVGRLPSLEWWDPSRRREVVLPECNILRKYWESVHHSRLTVSQKTRAYSVIVHWAWKYHRKLLGDFVLAADQVLWKWQTRHTGTLDHAINE